jgi:hypothetical protein
MSSVISLASQHMPHRDHRPRYDESQMFLGFNVMICLFCCNQNRSVWIDCSKNSKYEISREKKKSGGKCAVACAWVDDRAGGMIDTRTHKHTCIYAGRRTHPDIY